MENWTLTMWLHLDSIKVYSYKYWNENIMKSKPLYTWFLVLLSLVLCSYHLVLLYCIPFFANSSINCSVICILWCFYSPFSLEYPCLTLDTSTWAWIIERYDYMKKSKTNWQNSQIGHASLYLIPSSSIIGLYIRYIIQFY